MNSFLLKALVVTMLLSAPLATTAHAKSIANQDASPSRESIESKFIIASPFRKEISPSFTRGRFLTEVLTLEMKMMELAEEGLKSNDPEIRKMSQELLNSSEAMSTKIIKMFDFRRNPAQKDILP